MARYPDGGEPEVDRVAVEEPLEIRVDGEPLAVLMRTPGDDLALTAGFLLTEGVILDRDDLRALAPCRDPANRDRGNVVLVSLAAGAELARSRLTQAQRRFFTSSSCGLCGKATIASLVQDVPTYPTPLALAPSFLLSLGERVRAAQAVFDQTGGLHAAAVVHTGGALLALAEDIGRHNAVDKALGRLVLDDALPGDDAVLWVSGRASFELVQKALVARLRALVCVGAPSSLAVELASAAGLTLVGFARGGRYNVYTARSAGA
ncbi:MAG: formate dehydrogenase accessory sulfurtransferase FdhD [Deltaproteobacteria bacterium]|nr:MAG: formate dehydrogenase accessory sulfurtransferase FdhD [Deltaproteobacteria bacterium]